MNLQNEILTLNEACDYLRVSRPTLVKLLKNGKLKGFKVGKRAWKISRREIDRFICAGNITNIK